VHEVRSFEQAGTVAQSGRGKIRAINRPQTNSEDESVHADAARRQLSCKVNRDSAKRHE
jgi:hypothetical protein